MNFGISDEFRLNSNGDDNNRKKWHNNKKFDEMELEIAENHSNRMNDSENFDNLWKLIGIRVAAETEQDGP